jgi:hypothetical protein
MLPNVDPFIYDVKISGVTRSSIYIYIYIYDISRLRVKSSRYAPLSKGVIIFCTVSLVTTMSLVLKTF